MQRAEVERLASDALSHPADLFSVCGGVADERGVDGVADLVDQAAHGQLCDLGGAVIRAGSSSQIGKAIETLSA